MVSLKDIRNIYFIGIGGIGMSAVARFFLSRNVRVSGYDKTETPLTKQLVQEGAVIHYSEDVSLLDKDAQLVVYTPAIPKNHLQWQWYLENSYSVVKRSDVLQIITADTFNICIAGTHGKTSMSTMVGHVLRHSGYGCNVFLGGISVNYETNFWSSSNEVCVVEADEFDRSFLKLSPDIAVVSSMDADHLDIYGTVEKMEDAFVEFTQRTKPGGLLIRKLHLQRLNNTPIKRQLTYQLQNETVQPHHHEEHTHDDHHHHHDDLAEPDIFASNIQVVDGGYLFDAHVASQTVAHVRMNIGGMHNIENMLVAISIAKSLKIDDDKIRAAVAEYKGVKRRFEYLHFATDSKGEKQIAIDDYAHHPEELRALINSTKQLFPGMEMTIVFQPHLFSRTRDLATEFAAVLSLADHVVLLPIYPARELPMEGVTSYMIAEKMDASKVAVMEKDAWIDSLNKNIPALLVTAGAGDIDALLPIVKEKLSMN